MKLWALLQPLLLAAPSAVKKPTHWMIDGQNLLGHGGTTKDRDSLVATLKTIDVRSAEELVVVFDGPKNDASAETKVDRPTDNLRIVELGEGLIADDYIQQAIQEIVADPLKKRKHRVNVVSADRALRKIATTSGRPVVKNVVNPVTFFKRYLPRLKRLKGPSEDRGAGKNPLL